MNSDIFEQVIVIAIGALFTLLIWGAVIWWTIAESRRSAKPRQPGEPNEFDEHSRSR